MRSSGKSFKVVVNNLLSLGLAQARKPEAAPAFKVTPRAMGPERWPKLRRYLRTAGSAGGARTPLIVLDANLLLYAYDSASAEHKPARAWVEEALSGVESVGLPWQTISAFLRIATNIRLPGNRFTIEEAAAIVDQWVALPVVHFLAPRDRHWAFFRRLLVEGKASGPLTTDAQLAALTIENGGVLYTTDRDFARFPGLKWVNPLAGS